MRYYILYIILIVSYIFIYIYIYINILCREGGNIWNGRIYKHIEHYRTILEIIETYYKTDKCLPWLVWMFALIKLQVSAARAARILHGEMGTARIPPPFPSPWDE